MPYTIAGSGIACSSGLRRTSQVMARRACRQLPCRACGGKLRPSNSSQRSGIPRLVRDPPGWWRGTVIMARLSTQTPANGDLPAAAHAEDRRSEILHGAVGIHRFRREIRGSLLRSGKISRSKRDFFRFPGLQLQARIRPSSQLPGVAVMSGKVAGVLSRVAVPNDRRELDGRNASVTRIGR